jgi:hypothetical protein
VDELPHRAVIDLEAAFVGQLLHQTAQLERPFPPPPTQPVGVLTGDLPRLVSADPVGRDAAAFRDSPSSFTAATTRLRKSIE